MCGIGGYVGWGADIDEEALSRQLRHRGPDDEGTRRLAARDGTPVLLAFRRLAILDLSPAGNQPMATEDGRLTLVYNGETYNFRALRAELAARGHRFRSASDTEVVLRGFREWGPEVLSRMRGMFALALWDADEQVLLLARDRLGIKPLYYHHDGRRLCFGSELRTLLLSGAVPRRLDPRGVHGFLALGSVPQPGTIIRDVVQLLPGHFLLARVRDGQVQPPVVRRYFALPAPQVIADDTAARAEVAEVLQEAVALRLIADVPVGVLLSGGIDSTAVAVLARRAQAELRTFSLTYGHQHDESEGAFAGQAAALLSARHTEELLTADAVLAQVPAYLSAVDQPSVDGLNTYLVAGLVRRAGLKVALSGLGGDEVFLGYRLPFVFAAAYRLGRLPRFALGWDQGADLWRAKAAMMLSAMAQEPAARARGLYAVLRGLFPAAWLAAVCDPDLGAAAIDPAEHVRLDLPEELGRLPALDVAAYLDLGNYLPNTLLRDADVMSMAHGVELRVPLCDHVLVSRVLALGAAARVRWRRKKPLLTDACGSALVEGAAARRKRGFALPIAAFLRRELRDAVAGVLCDGERVRACGLRPAVAARLWHDFDSGRARGSAWRVWALFTLLSWASLRGVRV